MASLPIPPELKEFHRAFSDLSYRHSDTEVFDDLLLWIMAGFSFDIKWEPKGRYTKEETPKFFEMFRGIVLAMQEMLKKREWYDPFGAFYESGIAGASRRAKAGQFFTPCNIADMMVQLQATPGEYKGKGLRISDPTCGSGRMLIAYHAYNPGNYVYGEDMDRTCCLMTVCNMLLHGAVGEVIWHDSLDPESFYGGWNVNQSLNLTGIPTVKAIEKEESFIIYNWRKRRMETEKRKESPEPRPIVAGTQLSLFE